MAQIVLAVTVVLLIVVVIGPWGVLPAYINDGSGPVSGFRVRRSATARRSSC
ncbi:hypothetical protein HBB16_01560 [Pseudonocardia sp. MCCB 268]|nr:hypothetical protein [Pseudonocardia cytotoxica]